MAVIAHTATRMTAAYLYLNSALYGLFAAWCTLRWRQTAASLGYGTLNGSGSSEYLVIYGGLQWGLAAMFFMLARQEAADRHALSVALGIYIPIVIYRVATVWQFWPVAPLTLAVAALEVALLAAGAVLWWMA